MVEGPTERPIPKTVKKDIRKAEGVVKKAKEKNLIDNPLARFNLNLDGQNPDWEAKDGTKSPAHEKKKLSPSEKVKDPKTGQQLNVLKSNWEKFDSQSRSRVLVFLPPYNNAVDTGATNYRAEQLGRQIDGPVLSIDHPGMGKSDKLTSEQKKALQSDEGYDPVAEAELRVMKEMGITDIDLVGQSMGAWAAVSLAKKAESLGIKVHNLIVVDSPGEKEMKEKTFGGELTSGEMSEGKYLDLYQSAPYDTEMRSASGQHHSAVKKNADLARWALSSLANDPRGIYRKAMARESLTDDIADALHSNPDLRVKIVNGTLSRISPQEANAKLVKILSERYPDRVSQAIFQGEPHLVMEPAKRFASFVKTVIRK